MREESLDFSRVSSWPLRALASLTIFLASGTWCAGQTSPLPLPQTVLDTTCCAYPRLRWRTTSQAVAEALPGNRDAYWGSLRLLERCLFGLERAPHSTAAQLSLAHTALYNLSRAVAGRYDLRPWYLELAHQRRRLVARDEAAYRADSVERLAADSLVDAWDARDRALRAQAEARHAAEQAELRQHLVAPKLWGFICGGHGRRVHYRSDCPGYVQCQDAPHNVELERMLELGLSPCAWCRAHGQPLAAPVVR